MSEPRSRVLQRKDANSQRAWGTQPDDLDLTAIRSARQKLSPWFGPERAWFRTEVRGWEHVPDRHVLIVGNHSGGTSIPDVWGWGSSWYRHFGDARPLHALAHEMVFALDAVGRRFARMGILRASRSMGERVLTDWERDLLVYPGGDLDTWRPWTRRYTVRFADRVGYARLAIRTGTPVLPVAHAGAHDTLVVLTDGRRVAERLGFPELFRARVFPVHLSLPFGLAVGPTPHLPPPTRLRYRIGPAVAPPAWGRPHDPPEALVRAFDGQVRAALQRELDILRDERETLVDRARHLARRVGGRVQALATALAA